MTCKPTLLRKIALIACGAFLWGCFHAQPAKAQFIGFTSPQSVQQTLANGVACTGSAQTFAPQNLGQTQHFISITTTNAVFLRAEIDGIDTAGNVYRISDVLRAAINNTNASVVAYGYYPKIQISVTCSAASTFTLAYSGASASSGPLAGSYQLGQNDKVIATAASANTIFNDTIQTPYGNSQGMLYFNFVGTGPTGSTLTVNCTPIQATGIIDTFSLPVTAGQYVFVVPSGTCPFATVTYTPGGASATTINIEYAFTPPGLPIGQAVYSPTALGVNALTEPMGGTTNLSQVVDTRGVREATLQAACTTGNWTINLQPYADDGVTTFGTAVTPVSAIAAAANAILTIGSESNPAVNTGTLSTTALIRLPQRALAFSFTNAGGAGTCTARLFLTY